MATAKQCTQCDAQFRDMGVVECEYCLGGSFVHVEIQGESFAEAPQFGAQGKLDTAIAGRSSSEHLEVIEKLVSELASTKKYAKAIRQGSFATFSLIGTNDWEDYASLSISALNAISLANISRNLEEVVALLKAKA
jgi:hypothetical protein